MNETPFRNLKNLRKSLIDPMSSIKRFIPGFKTRSLPKLSHSVSIPQDVPWNDVVSNTIGDTIIAYKSYSSMVPGEASAQNLNLDLYGGSAIATMASTRGIASPATYIDINHRIAKVVSHNTGRITSGFYDTTGFVSRPGLIVEGASTNLISNTDGTSHSSGLWNGWLEDTDFPSPSRSNPLIPDLTSIAGATSQRVQYVGVGDGYYGWNPELRTLAGTVDPGDVLTISYWIRSRTGSNCFYFAFIGFYQASDAFISGNSVEVNAYPYWTRISFTTTAPALTSRVDCFVDVDSVAGSVVDMEVYGIQVEKKSYATSFIPTGASPVTRNLEWLKYPISGNRSASTETVIMDFTTPYTMASPLKAFLSTDTKVRYLTNSAGTKFDSYPNITDNAGVVASSSTVLAPSTSYVTCSVFKHSSPYAQTYINGASEGTYTSGDWTNPVWGTNMHVGSNSSGTQQADCIIQTILIFSEAKTSSEVSTISNVLSGFTGYSISGATFTSDCLVQNNIDEKTRRDINAVKIVPNQTLNSGTIRYFISNDGTNFPIEVLTHNAEYALPKSDDEFDNFQTKFNDLRVRIITTGDAVVTSLKIFYSLV